MSIESLFCQFLWQSRWRSTTSSHWSWMPQVRQVMADHLGLPVLDQSLKEAFSPRFVNCQPTQVVLLSTWISQRQRCREHGRSERAVEEISRDHRVQFIYWLCWEPHSCHVRDSWRNTQPSVNNKVIFNTVNCAQSPEEHSKGDCRVTDDISWLANSADLHFYWTQVRSLFTLVSNWLTDLLPFSRLDWCDVGVWRW